MSLSIKYDRLSCLPPLVRSFVYSHDAWIVGGSAKYLLGLDDRLRDFDVLVPFYTWGLASKTVPPGTVANSHGGFKITDGGFEIDVWAGDVGWFISKVLQKPTYAVHLSTYTILEGNAGYEKPRIENTGTV